MTALVCILAISGKVTLRRQPRWPIMIYENDPFAKLDQHGVGRLISNAARWGRSTNPHIHVGICGEHGGDPASVEFCHKIGLDYVSCSPLMERIAQRTKNKTLRPQTQGLIFLWRRLSVNALVIDEEV